MIQRSPKFVNAILSHTIKTEHYKETNILTCNLKIKSTTGDNGKIKDKQIEPYQIKPPGQEEGESTNGYTHPSPLSTAATHHHRAPQHLSTPQTQTQMALDDNGNDKDVTYTTFEHKNQLQHTPKEEYAHNFYATLRI